MDSLELQRFVDAQNPVLADVYAELKNGKKRSHWMWFVFPQIHHLGHSDKANYFSIKGMKEAKAYLFHDILGPRLIKSCELLLAHRNQDIGHILGSTDSMKLKSSMTLFHLVDPENPFFRATLKAFFNSEKCSRTLQLVESSLDERQDE